MEIVWGFIKEQIANNQFFQGGALTAALFGVWGAVKRIFPFLWARIVRLLVYEVIIDTAREYSSITYRAMVLWATTSIQKKMRRVRAFVDNNGLEYEQTEDYAWIWYKRSLLLISKEREKVDSAHGLTDRYEDRYVIKGLSKANIDAFINDVYLQYIDFESKKKGLSVFSCSRTNVFDRASREIPIVKSFSNLYFKGKEALIADIDRFVGSRKRYQRLGIPFKRGYLLTGPPGTGKSSCVLAIADYLRKNVYTIQLSDIKSDSELIDIVMGIPNGGVIAFEDIDVFFTQDRSSTETKITFSAFLNCIDGLYAPSDAIMVMTTNYPERLDLALMRRGRLDYTLEIGLPSSKEISNFLNDFYEESVTFMPKEGKSMADVQETALTCATLKDFEKAWMV